MATNAGTLEFLSRELARALTPLADRLADGGGGQLLSELGLRPPPGLTEHADVAAELVRAATSAAELAPLVVELTDAITADDLAEIAAAGAALVAQIRALATAMDDLGSGVAAAGGAIQGLTAEQRAQIEAFASALPRRLFDFMLLEHLTARFPSAVALLEVLGLVDRRSAPSAPDDPLIPPHIRREIRVDRLGDLLHNPQAYARAVYGWGDPGFDGIALFENLRRYLEEGLDLPALVVRPAGQPAILEAFLFALRVDGQRTPPGLRASLRFPGTRDFAHTYPLALPWALTVKASGRFVADVAVGIAPPGTFELRPPSGSVEAALEAALVGDAAQAPLLLFGVAGGTRLEADKVSLGFGLTAIWSSADGRATAEPSLSADIDGGKLVLDLSAGDSFIQSILSDARFEADFDLSASWRPSAGLTFGFGGTAELELPMHRQLGSVMLRSVALAFEASTAAPLAVRVGAGLSARLGPLNVTVARIGAKGALSLRSDGTGNLGPVDLAFGFKPPDGVGLSIDAGAVTGGGFLFFDADKEHYAGALHLEVEGGLALSAFGLLTTRMPDGSAGFSLLVLVQASGFAPVPLGFGFTLTGVGGLLGINRTVDVEVLRAGLRNRTLDAILFSQDDPTPRAPHIVSTLGSVFPPAPDQYVFGPMVQIAWGPPPSPLLTIEVALVLELPAPLRLVVLGRVSATLPTPAQAIVRLRLDVVGVVDFDRRRLAVDATLYDSFVGPFALSGDMAARASWGETPDFAVALGGFHPAFRPPEGFPALRRLALTLSSGDNPRLRMEAYLALTSNTVQLGARLEFYVAAAGFSLEGGFGFDTLITLSPFRLQAQIDAGLTLKRGSTTLAHLGVHVNLVGPAPWEVWGTASISILFLDIKVPFHATFGEPAAVPEPERVDVWALLKAQLSHPANWATALPAADNRLATLVALPGQGDALVHPLGAVSVTQRLVPLERTLTLFGPAPPAEANFFEIAGAAALAQGDDVYDYFAPAQFRSMSDAEKLSSPSFDRMVSGAAFGPPLDAVTIGTVARAPLDYETALVFDLDDPTRQRADAHRPSGEAVATLAERGAAAVAELRDQGREKFAPPAPGPALAEPEYVVATQDTLAAEADAHDGTYSGAVEALRGRPDAERYQVVRREELELAAP